MSCFITVSLDPTKVYDRLKDFADEKNLLNLEPGDAFLKLQTIMNTIQDSWFSIGGDLVMHVNDFPKGTRSDCLTVITITTEPPIICHGSGLDSTSSRDEAALEV